MPAIQYPHLQFIEFNELKLGDWCLCGTSTGSKVGVCGHFPQKEYVIFTIDGAMQQRPQHVLRIETPVIYFPPQPDNFWAPNQDPSLGDLIIQKDALYWCVPLPSRDNQVISLTNGHVESYPFIIGAMRVKKWSLYAGEVRDHLLVQQFCSNYVEQSNTKQ